MVQLLATEGGLTTPLGIICAAHHSPISPGLPTCSCRALEHPSAGGRLPGTEERVAAQARLAGAGGQRLYVALLRNQPGLQDRGEEGGLSINPEHGGLAHMPPELVVQSRGASQPQHHQPLAEGSSPAVNSSTPAGCSSAGPR